MPSIHGQNCINGDSPPCSTRNTKGIGGNGDCGLRITNCSTTNAAVASVDPVGRPFGVVRNSEKVNAGTSSAVMSLERRWFGLRAFASQERGQQIDAMGAILEGLEDRWRTRKLGIQG